MAYAPPVWPKSSRSRVSVSVFRNLSIALDTIETAVVPRPLTTTQKGQHLEQALPALDPEQLQKHIEIARGDTDAEAYTLLGDAQHRPIERNHFWTMRPGNEVINRTTGEITIVPEHVFYRDGDLTVSQLADRLGLGPRQARATLTDLGILHEELEAKMIPFVTDPRQTKPEYSSRLRLSEWAVKMRYGRRVTAGRGYDLDWITPAGVAHIDEMLAFGAKPAAPQKKPKAIDVIERLLAGDPKLRQVDIVRLSGLSKMTVHRNLRHLGKR